MGTSVYRLTGKAGEVLPVLRGSSAPSWGAPATSNRLSSTDFAGKWFPKQGLWQDTLLHGGHFVTLAPLPCSYHPTRHIGQQSACDVETQAAVSLGSLLSLISYLPGPLLLLSLSCCSFFSSLEVSRNCVVDGTLLWGFAERTGAGRCGGCKDDGIHSLCILEWIEAQEVSMTGWRRLLVHPFGALCV